MSAKPVVWLTLEEAAAALRMSYDANFDGDGALTTDAVVGNFEVAATVLHAARVAVEERPRTAPQTVTMRRRFTWTPSDSEARGVRRAIFSLHGYPTGIPLDEKVPEALAAACERARNGTGPLSIEADVEVDFHGSIRVTPAQGES